MSLAIFNGLTSQTVDLLIADTASTTGGGKTGLVYNTSGLSAWYRKGATGTLTQITLATQTVGGAWSSGGFVEIDATNAPGLCRLDLPNAAVDTAGFTTVIVKGTGLVMAPVRIDCRPVNTVTNVTTVNDSRMAYLDSYISAINNLSSLCNLLGPPLLEIPDSGSAVYIFTVAVKDQEGKMVALDASPSIVATNASGTDRSANLSAVSNPSTGRYTFTYTVSSSATQESIRIVATGAVSGEARYAEWVGVVVDYAAYTMLAAIKAKTDNLPGSPAAVGSAMTLTSEYDAAKTAATQTSLDTAALWSKRGATVLVGTISTAGTSTEIYTLDGVTVTATVDSSGNRSSVVFS